KGRSFKQKREETLNKQEWKEGEAFALQWDDRHLDIGYSNVLAVCQTSNFITQLLRMNPPSRELFKTFTGSQDNEIKFRQGNAEMVKSGLGVLIP
ncbi:hypothetical protein SFRURICE_002399, partial [Spodoptera frugiperda]